MKIAKSIVVALMIGSPFVPSVPASAGNGWIDAATSIKGNTIYVRPLSRDGNFVTYEETQSESNGVRRYVANCGAWQYRRLSGSNWFDVMPNSIGAAAHETVCSANVPALMTYTTASYGAAPNCNEKVDAAFYRRYPELRGTKLTSMNGTLASEWLSIQSSLC